MKKSITKFDVTENFAWRFAERCGAQGVKFLIEIILARLLLPEDYGIIALVTVFINIFNVFVDSGLGNALIQKKNADNIDFSTVFFFNIIWCIVLYFVLFALAPIIATFYAQSELTKVIRVLGVTIIISGVKNVQQAYVSVTMQFKRFFYATLGGTLGAATVGITLAYMGAGVWALVAQQVFNATVGCFVLWVTVRWRPEKSFSLLRLKKLFSYGWKLLTSTLLNTIYNNIYQLIIGKYYSTSELAYYNKGDQFPKLFLSNINDSIDSVLLPVMSKIQDDKTRLKHQTSMSIKVSTYIMAPLMLGLISIAPTLVTVLLTEKWLPCVPFLQIFCGTYLFYPIHTANLNAIKAVGRSDIFLELEIIKKIIGIGVLFLVVKRGPMNMAISLFLLSIISQAINCFPNKKLLNYGYWEQINDIMPNIIMAIIMAICVYMFGLINMPITIKLILQVLIGILIYIAESLLLRNKTFTFLLDILKGIKIK